MRPSQGACNGENDTTPGRAALRDFDPAYVGSGSFSPVTRRYGNMGNAGFGQQADLDPGSDMPLVRHRRHPVERRRRYSRSATIRRSGSQSAFIVARAPT